MAAADNEIIISRMINAPRSRVWEAWTTVDHLAQWWGPNGFTTTTHEFDFSEGGYWRFMMHGPDGTNYDNAKEFIEVVEPERIVFKHLQPMHQFQMTMTFADFVGGTKLTWLMQFESSDNPKLKSMIAEANEQNFDRLEAYLGLKN